ncbi:MAG TPA: phosphatase PAP2 family protein [Ramlibacter sp.]|uniref:phosphatase PAP2 family protein n=1 Tax=Ramlibacter sp. TaxID=1917967 RepID=UPI002ED560D0
MTTRWSRALPESAWITFALLAVALAWDASGLDLPFAHLAGSAQGFPWKDHWFLFDVLHEGGRHLAWLLVLGLCLAVWWPVGPLERITLRRRVQLAVSTLAAALAVGVLKKASLTSCPWELAQFGGVARYASHWSRIVDGGAGQCFPAGHASSGFAFLGGYFVFRDVDLRLARRWLLGATAAGLVLGLAQQWRGAHFMSHTLWTAVVCWIVACGVDAAWPQATALAGS